MGTNIDRNIDAFLSTQTNCLEDSTLYNSISISMLETPDLIYKENGKDIAVWSEVIIKRNYNKRTRAIDAKPDTFDLLQKLYLCIKSNDTYIYSGIQYLVLGPGLVNKKRFMTQGHFQTLLNTKWYNKLNNILLITFISQPNKYVDCESSNFHQYTENVMYTFYNFKRSLVSFPKHLEINNALICWCGGSSCASISNYSTTIFFPSFNGVNINVLKTSDGPLKLAYSAPMLSVFDQIRIVLPVVRCGRTYASTMSTNLIVNSQGSYTNSPASEPLNYYGLANKYTYNNNNFIWESHILKLRDMPNSTNLAFKVCYCSFSASERCKIDEDFRDTTGLILRNSTEAVINTLMHIRIFRTYSAQGDNNSCSIQNIDSLFSLGYSFKVYGDIGHASTFVKEFISRYASLEGFNIESCIVEHSSDSSMSKNYVKFIAEHKKGFYRPQKINIKSKIPQNIVIRGNDVSGDDSYKLAIITVDLNCNDSDDNNILIASSSKTAKFGGILFEKIAISKIGTYKLCISLSDSDSKPGPASQPNDSAYATTKKDGAQPELKWFYLGILRVKEYYLNNVSDLLPFNPLEIKYKNNNSVTYKTSTCSLTGYTDLVQIGVLLMDQLIILVDCANNVWASKFDIKTGVVKVSENRNAVVINFKEKEEETNWLLCKEIKSEKYVIFLGEQFVVLYKYPFDIAYSRIEIVFRHNLVSPLDVTMVDDIVLVSDAFTRTIRSYSIVNLTSGRSFKNIYCISIELMITFQKSVREIKLFCLNPERNTINIFKLSLIGHSPTLFAMGSYDGKSDAGYVTVGRLTTPCSMDFYKNSNVTDENLLLFVAENKTGRIIIFKLVDGNISGYKIIYTRGLISRIKVDSKSNIIYISSWRNNLGKLEQFIQNKPIESYIDLTFFYDVKDKYQSGDEIDIEPVKKGDYFEFFYEKDDKPQQNVAPPTLDSVGLELDFHTGKISGKLNVTGKYSFTIYGGNLLKEVTTTVNIFASCPPSQQFNKKDKSCHDCPVGTFRNDEPEDVCVPCTSVRANSTTKLTGTKHLWDCMCEPGYFLKEEQCVLCEEGTWKSEIGDSPCTGTCGINMSSLVVGAKTLEELKCQCDPRFYNIKSIASKDDIIPIEFLHFAGLASRFGVTYKEIDGPLCIPCEVGYFCPGGDTAPQFCGTGKSTKDRFSSSEDDCECDKGYGFTTTGCIPCSRFGYKDVVGNAPCKYCHSHLSQTNTKPLNLYQDLFKFNSTDQFSNNIGLYESFVLQLNKFIKGQDSWVLVAKTQGSTAVTDCKYCISGYYFDSNVKDCVKCPFGSYCEGYDNQPQRCSSNSILTEDKAISSINCKCPIRYGNVYPSRNPINLSVECEQCPIGFFQHLASTDTSCFPCPQNSTTHSIGSSSILSCIPDPGYYIEVLLQVPVALIVETDNQTADESFETKHLNFRTDSNAVSVNCQNVPARGVSSRHTADVLRETEQQCHKECMRNIYCAGYAFDIGGAFFLKDITPYNTNGFYLFDGSKFTKVQFKVCRLYFFTLDISKDTGKGSEIIKVCEISAPFPFQSLLCPINSYCSGTRIPTPCHEHSITVDIGSTSIDSCLCIPGYEPSTTTKGKCVPCNIGWYKEEVGNSVCKRCPDKFKTFHTGSKHSTDCACTQGYYAVLDDPDKELSIVNDYIITEKSIFKKNSEIPVDVKKRVDDYNRMDNIIDYRYRLSLSDSLILVPYGLRTATESGKVYKIRCEKCIPDHYCPGGWLGYMDSDYENNTNIRAHNYKIHNIPYKCPIGSGIPPQSTNPSSLSHCLCLPGYMPEGTGLYNYDSSQRHDSLDAYFTSIMSLVIRRTYANRCSPCESGMFKEGLENSPCSGRCMEYATTYGGSVSKSQCFCHYGRYMTLKRRSDMLPTKSIEDYYKNLKCTKCMKGATCPGGLELKTVNILKRDYNYDKITLKDHVKPMPKQGYFPAYPSYNNIERINSTWSPNEQNVSIAERVDTQFLEFHPCQLEFRCGGGFSGYCLRGSTGYLCNKCIARFDMVNFRSRCVKCQSAMKEISSYLAQKLPLFLTILLILLLSHYNLESCCVLLKIFVEFYFTLLPYGIISVYTKSSIKPFVPAFNGIFGHSVRMFTYIRVNCLHKAFQKYYIDVWYAQKLISIIIPLLDAVVLVVAWYIFKRTFGFIKRVFLAGTEPRPMLIDSAGAEPEPRGNVSFLKILTASYFLQIHFAWIDLFHTIWCVSVKYKDQNAISVLLHMPEQLCSLKNKKFLAVFIASAFIILVSIVLAVLFIARFNSSSFGRFLGYGYRERYRAWDSASLFTRFMLAIICTFHITIHSPSNSGRLRVISTIMLSSLVGVVHLIIAPFNLRNDNLFNKLKVLGICINIATGCMIQGSYSYDFNYVSLTPIFLFAGFCFVLAWYLMVEIGRISWLDNVRKVNTRRFRDYSWRCVSKMFHFFTSWHNEAEITYNIKAKRITVETPFVLDYSVDASGEPRYSFRQGINSRLGNSGRNRVSLSIHQSMNKLVLEKKTLRVPNYWLEFIINYTMTKYDSYKREQGDRGYTSLDEMVITPWIISKFTLDASKADFDDSLRVFDPENPNLVKEVRDRYDKKKEHIITRIGGQDAENRDTDCKAKLNSLLEITHLKGELEERLEKLKLELNRLIENAKQGERAVEFVLKIRKGVEESVNRPLTNEEILMRISESTNKRN